MSLCLYGKTHSVGDKPTWIESSLELAVGPQLEFVLRGKVRGAGKGTRHSRNSSQSKELFKFVHGNISTAVSLG